MGALEGMRVIDAASFMTGPWAAMMLGDLGADVIKVEFPPGGDPFRRFGKQRHGHGVTFANVNRNKRSVVLDVRAGSGRDAFERLLVDADVLITNSRPDATRRLGLDDELVARHPRLVWVRITGFGFDGPMADLPAFDSIIQARTGLASASGGDGPPSLVPAWVCDKVTGMFAAQAALAALLSRSSSGRGQLIDVPMLDAMAYFNFPDMMVERTALDDAAADARNVHLASQRPVRTSDGWILVNLVRGRQIASALEALGLQHRQAELRAITDPAKLSAVLCDVVEEATSTRSTDACLALLAAADVPAGPVLDLDGHLADPQVEHNGVYITWDDPRLGPIRGPRYPARSDAGLAVGPRPAPGLDEHRDDVLGR